MCFLLATFSSSATGSPNIKRHTEKGLELKTIASPFGHHQVLRMACSLIVRHQPPPPLWSSRFLSGSPLSFSLAYDVGRLPSSRPLNFRCGVWSPPQCRVLLVSFCCCSLPCPYFCWDSVLMLHLLAPLLLQCDQCRIAVSGALHLHLPFFTLPFTP